MPSLSPLLTHARCIALLLGLLPVMGQAAPPNDFVGPELTLGLTRSKTVWTGGSFFNLNTGAGPSGTVSDSARMAWQPKIGMTYGWDLNRYFLAWVGLDVTGSETVSGGTLSNGGGTYSLTVQRRRDAYIAVGDRIGTRTVQYLRYGQSVFSFGDMTDERTGQALGGDLNRHGRLLGVGLRHRFDDNSRWSYTLDYHTIRTENRVLSQPGASSLGYASKLTLQSLSVAASYAF